MAWQPFKNWWLPGWLADPFRRCDHSQQRGIYGDEINWAGGKRANCLKCGRWFDRLPTADQRQEPRP